MSLRLRLLLAVGAIAIIALVVADFATYSALRSSLYNQVDQELAAAPPDRLPRRCGNGGGASARRPTAASGERRSRQAPVPVPARCRRRGRGRLRQHLRDQLRLGRQSERQGRRRSQCPAYVGKHAVQPAAARRRSRASRPSPTAPRPPTSPPRPSRAAARPSASGCPGHGRQTGRTARSHRGGAADRRTRPARCTRFS